MGRSLSLRIQGNDPATTLSGTIGDSDYIFRHLCPLDLVGNKNGALNDRTIEVIDLLKYSSSSEQTNPVNDPPSLLRVPILMP